MVDNQFISKTIRIFETRTCKCVQNGFKHVWYIPFNMKITEPRNHKFGHQKFFIGVYNILNNANPLYFDIKRNKFDANVYEVSVTVDDVA